MMPFLSLSFGLLGYADHELWQGGPKDRRSTKTESCPAGVKHVHSVVRVGNCDDLQCVDGGIAYFVTHS